MQDETKQEATSGTKPPTRGPRTFASAIWPALAGVALALAAGAVTVRLAAGARFDGLLIAAAVFSAVVVALRLQANPRHALPVTRPQAPVRTRARLATEQLPHEIRGKCLL